MADSTIGNLNAYTTPIDTDVLPIVDVTSGITKKITVANVKAKISPDATVSVKGIAEITPAPASAGTPIALGSNFATVSGTPLDNSSNKIMDGAAGEVLANKDTTTTLGTSDTKYPSQNAVKTYVDTQIPIIASETPVKQTVGSAFDVVVNLNGNASTSGVAVGVKIGSQVGTMYALYFDTYGNVRVGASLTSSGTNLYNGLCSVGTTVYISGVNVNSVQYFRFATYNGGTSWTTGDITFSGTAPVLNDAAFMYSDGTYVYIVKYNGGGVFRKYSCSGGTLTYVADYTPAGTVPTYPNYVNNALSYVNSYYGTIFKSLITQQKYTLPSWTSVGAITTPPTSIGAPFDHSINGGWSIAYDANFDIVCVGNSATPIITTFSKYLSSLI